MVDFVKWSMEDGVEAVTVYAFSTENWGRDPVEVVIDFGVRLPPIYTQILALNITLFSLHTNHGVFFSTYLSLLYFT